MRVGRIGFTPVKGGHHQTHPSVCLTAPGPAGDRAFCLVDLDRARCLRTVENPTMLRTRASWDGRVLSVRTPTRTAVGEPRATGELRTIDYWGRPAHVELVDGPWAAAYSAHLEREVVLAASAPGEVVYRGSVSLVTSASLRHLSELVRAPVDGARFRATFQLDDEELEPGAETAWVGRRLRLGAAEVKVTGLVPRCGVVDLEPGTGARDLAVLKVLARRQTLTEQDRPDGLTFGLSAEVTTPGLVKSGDVATLVALS